MDFILTQNTVKCLRSVRDEVTGTVSEKLIASFDSQLNTIAPHVKAVLSKAEIEQLEYWMEDRRKVRARTAEETLFEVLLNLLTQGTDILQTLPDIDQRLYADLTGAAESFLCVLAAKRESTSSRGQEDLREMRQSEALKQRLGHMKDGM